MNSFTIRENIRKLIEPMIASRFLTLAKNDPNSKLKVDNTVPNLNYYLFTGPEARHDCFYQHDLVFPLGVIPSYCQKNCWKTIINVKSVIQVHALYEFMKEEEIMGKAGADPREYTFGYWRGFCYHYTSEAALDMRDKLRRIIPGLMLAVDPDRPISTDDIYVVRGCTEYNLKSESSGWHVDRDTKDVEAMLREYIDPDYNDYKQTPWIASDCIQAWIKQAFMIGDPTWEKLAHKHYGIGKMQDGTPMPVVLYRPSTKYERE